MLLSINITSYNRPKLFIQCFKSILNQNIKKDNLYELIIVDDNSEPKNLKEIKKFLKGYEVNLIENKENMKLSYSRNIAINNAIGQWYTFCDDDDEWPENMVLKFKELLDNDNFDADIVLFLDEKLKSSWESFSSNVRLRDIIIAGVTPPVSSIFYKTKMLREVDGYNTNVFSGVDHGLWIRLCKKINPKVAICWSSGAIVCNDFFTE